MLETKEQKQMFAGTMVLIILLATVSIWRQPFYGGPKASPVAKQDITPAEAQAYLDYLSTLRFDPKASKELFQTILTEDDVRKEVVTALKADEPMQKPSIDEGRLNIR